MYNIVYIFACDLVIWTLEREDLGGHIRGTIGGHVVMYSVEKKRSRSSYRLHTLYLLGTTVCMNV
jgi:hypothetical protein